MSGNVKKIVMCFLLIMAVGSIIPSINSQAASKKNIKKAKAAYVKELKKAKKGNSSYTLGTDIKFALVDINIDGLPEMFITGDDLYHGTLLAYVSGKVKQVGYVFSGDAAVFTKRKVYYTSTIHTGDWFEEYYVFNGKEMKLVASKHGSDYMNLVNGKMKNYDNGEEITYEPFLYKVRGKNVSESEYDKYVARLTEGKRAKINLKKYNSQNRKKYLQ
ncbi:MAG: hypothetical protein IJV15_05565 [Lachnospiraceae bacterium]|nr:hypothetical protein [Lachnospiraceae bacterium]